MDMQNIFLIAIGACCLIALFYIGNLWSDEEEEQEPDFAEADLAETLNGKTKAELIAFANERNISIVSSWKKGVILEAILEELHS